MEEILKLMLDRRKDLSGEYYADECQRIQTRIDELLTEKFNKEKGNEN